MAENKPVKTMRLGRIRAAIFRNPTDDGGEWYGVVITRRYRTGDKWADTTTFTRDDLPVVGQVVAMAYAWIWEQQAVVSDDEAEAEEL